MAEEGGLMAYGPRFVTLYRQHARQVQKVLEGASPPVSLLARADELVE
jgi:hypothetical protein